MDAEELAFAGAARQAELIRAGEVSSRELVELYLERIERLDPKLNAFTEVLAERALAEADAADARRGAGERRRCSACRSRSRTTSTSRGRRPGSGPRAFDDARRDRTASRSAACAQPGARDHRQDDPPRARDLRFTETRGLGHDPQPVGPDALARRLERRQRRGGRRRASSAPPRRPTAAARSGSRPPSAACSASSRSAGACRWSRPTTGTGSRSSGCVTPHASPTRRSLTRRRRRRRPGRTAAAERPTPRRRDAAGQLRIAISEQARRGRSCRRSSPTRSRPGSPRPSELLRSLGHDVRRHDPSFGLTGNNFVPRYLGGIQRRRRRRSRTPERLESRTRGFAQLGRAYPAGAVRRAVRAAAAERGEDQPQLERVRRPGHPERRRDRDRGRPLGGRGALRTLLGDEPHLLLHPDLEPHRPAGGGGPGGVHRRAGCRAR